jgi:sugar transferase (PEP-CTERM/EpsH1 system associated)
MRILVHGSQLLYPANTGGRIRTSQLFERLSRTHDITWVCLRRPDETLAQVEAMSACCARIETFPFRETTKFSLPFYRELATNLAAPLPYVVHKYQQPALRARLGELLRTQRFDLLLCDFLQPSANLIDLPFTPRLLFQHNVESVIFQRHFQARRWGPAKAYLYLQWRKLLAYEARAAHWFDHNVMVSAQDVATMERLYGARNCSWIPTGVDADYFRPTASEAGGHELVFTGSMDWLPNVDGIRWFAAEVLPLLRRELPVKIWVVGRNPSPQVRELGARHPEIEVTGTVDDVRPHMARAQVFIVPLRIGGGTRMKIFEALAMGKAVVSTRVGAEGLPVTDGVHLALADEPVDFAGRVLALLRTPERRQALGAAGRKLVVDGFSWDRVAQRFSEICAEVVATRAPTGRG